MICALCAHPLVATKNGDSCPRCGVLTFGQINLKRKKVRLYCPVKKYGEQYSASGSWSSVKYSDDATVGWIEKEASFSE